MILNLLIGIIVDAIQHQTAADADLSPEDHGTQAVVIDHQKLRAELAEPKVIVMSLQRQQGG
jgi:hypothetical protein